MSSQVKLSGQDQERRMKAGFILYDFQSLTSKGDGKWKVEVKWFFYGKFETVMQQTKDCSLFWNMGNVNENNILWKNRLGSKWAASY